MKRVVVLASGRGSDLQSILDAVEAGWIRDARVTAVVSDDPEAQALERGRRAGATALPVPPVPKSKGGKEEHERRIIEAIEGTGRADLVVLAGYMRILSPRFVDAYTGRLINIHPALLPAFAGRDGVQDALDHGARLTGCTTHFVDHGVDSGPIILQAAVRVRPDDDRAALHARILKVEHQILPRTVDLFVQGRLQVEGRQVHIRPGDTWMEKVEPVPEALYPHGF